MARYEITNEQKPIEFEGLGEVKRIVQNCKNLLMTRLGEVPFDRLRGFNWALFDLRYSRSETARAFSGAADYVEAARAAVRWAWARRPQGLIVRLLVLPGHADEAIENLAWLATELSNEIPVSIMSQFTQAYKALETPPFNRSVTKEEYESVTEAAADFGFENG